MPNNPFIQLSSSIPTLTDPQDQASITGLERYESSKLSGAKHHYELGSEGGYNCKLLGAAGALTDQGTTPTASTYYTTLPSGYNNALLLPSGTTPRTDWTAMLVVESPTATGSGIYAPLFGNADTVTDGFMGGINVTSAGNENFFTRVTGGDGSSTNGYPSGNVADATLMVIAFGFDFSGSNKTRRLYTGGSTTDVTDTLDEGGAGTARQLAIGNGHYNGTYNTDIKIYSCIYWERLLTAAEMVECAKREVDRQTRRSAGLSVTA